MSSKVSKSRVSLRKPSCKTHTNLTVDGCSARAQAFECLNGLHISAVLPVRSFTAKGIYLKESRSGFEPESISGLEPETPLTTVDMRCNVHVIYIRSEIILIVYKN